MIAAQVGQGRCVIGCLSSDVLWHLTGCAFSGLLLKRANRPLSLTALPELMPVSMIQSCHGTIVCSLSGGGATSAGAPEGWNQPARAGGTSRSSGDDDLRLREGQAAAKPRDTSAAGARRGLRAHDAARAAGPA